MNTFNAIDEAIESIKRGEIVIVVDDEDRENEGDFVMAAEKVTSEAINFMAIHGRGLICTPITQERAVELELYPMVKYNNSQNQTAFTVSVDSIHVGTGISSHDRAITIKALVDKSTRASDLLRPGHIFPLISQKGGTLRRAGHTEAAVDLAMLAGLDPSGVICEIMNFDGTMARAEELFKIARQYQLKMVNIKDLIKYRREWERGDVPMIKQIEKIDFPNKYGKFQLYMFENKLSQGEPHMALVKGKIKKQEPVLVRVHSECFTGDIFGSLRCDCGEQLDKSMEIIEKEGRGVLLYMRQEGRGIGLLNKIKAYHLQQKGFDTVSANQKLGFKSDLREYGVGAQILNSLGVRKMKLLTNNPKKIVGLEGFDLEVVERCPIEIEANTINKLYLMTKRDKMGHLLSNLPN